MTFTATSQWLQSHVTSRQPHGNAMPIHCTDGFVVSVQASSYHYCSPRDGVGPYTHFELGFPSTADDALTEYAEDPARPTDTVYAWVPESTVLEVLNAHGGVDHVGPWND